MCKQGRIYDNIAVNLVVFHQCVEITVWERKYKVVNKCEVKSGILASDCTNPFAKVQK